MAKKKALRRQTPAAVPRRATPRRLAVIIGSLLVLSLVGGMLAQWRAAGVATKSNSLLTPVPTPTPTPLSLSKEYIYAGGKLVATEEPSNLSTLVSAPAALIATTASAAQINLSWTASTGPVDHYEIDKTGATSPITVTTNSFTDTSVSAGQAYLYKVRAVDAYGHSSLYSNIDLATAVTFLNDPLSSGTMIKAQHLTELRQAINAVRATAGLSAATWTDASPQGVRIKAIHVQEMRTALDQGLSALGLTVQSYTDPSLTNMRIKKEHFEQLRDRVK